MTTLADIDRLADRYPRTKLSIPCAGQIVGFLGHADDVAHHLRASKHGNEVGVAARLPTDRSARRPLAEGLGHPLYLPAEGASGRLDIASGRGRQGRATEKERHDHPSLRPQQP